MSLHEPFLGRDLERPPCVLGDEVGHEEGGLGRQPRAEVHVRVIDGGVRGAGEVQVEPDRLGGSVLDHQRAAGLGVLKAERCITRSMLQDPCMHEL